MLVASWHVAADKFGERFCRMWKMYLAVAETGFRYQNLMVFQLQLTKDQKALPFTRDYMHEAERELRLRPSSCTAAKRAQCELVHGAACAKC